MVKKSKSLSKAPEPNNAFKTTTLEMKVLALQAKNEELSKTLADTRQELSQLRSTINSLEKENFEVHSMCNTYKHVISNCEPLLQSTLTQIMGLSDNFYKVMHLQNVAKQLGINSPYRDLSSASTSKQGPSPCNTSNKERAYPIKPHMVNGHVLQIPTIKLTRVNEANLLQNTQTGDGGGETNENSRTNVSNNEPANRSIKRRTASSQTRSEVDRMDLSDLDLEEEPLPLNNVDGEPSHLETIQEESESSQYSSSQNSTVLSGVFQDVRIYLNQIPQEHVNRICYRKMCNQNNDRSYVCRPSLSERDKSSLCAEPSTSRCSGQGDTLVRGLDDSSDEEENTVETKIFRTSLEKKSFSFTQGTCNSDSYVSNNMSMSSTASSSSMESKNEDINSSKLVVMKELGLAPSHLTKTTTPELRKLRSRYQDSSTPKSPLHVTKRNAASSTVVRKSSTKASTSSNGGLVHSHPSTSTPIAEISRSSIELMTSRQVNSLMRLRSTPNTSKGEETPARNVNLKRGSSRSQKSSKHSDSTQVDVITTTVMHRTPNLDGDSDQENRSTPGRNGERKSSPSRVVSKISRSSETVSVQQIVNRVARELGVKRKITSPKYDSPNKIIKRNDGSRSPRKSSEGKVIVRKSATPKRKLGTVSVVVRKSSTTPKRSSHGNLVIRKSTSPYKKKSSNGKGVAPKIGSTPRKSSSTQQRKSDKASPVKNTDSIKKSPKSTDKRSTSTKKLSKKKIQAWSSPKMSPKIRPKRSARPMKLKEAPLNTKMRR